MAKIIYKYQLDEAEKQTIQLPEQFKIISIHYQGHDLFMWAIVDNDLPNKPVVIECYGTGHRMPDNAFHLHHITTIQRGGFVWHYFLNQP